MTPKEEFIAIFTENIKREGARELLAWLETTVFFTAPASSKYHCACRGGLVQHSVSVYHTMMEKHFEQGKDSEESFAICALLHDVCKAQFYKISTRNVKNEAGKWEQVPYFRFEEDFSYGGHGDKSVFLIMEHMKLSRDEAAAINAHMGFAGVQNVGAVSDVYDKNLLAWMLHVADEAATYIDKM